ncbi:HK97 family phage prohead protease [Labrenzia sp. PHM005]|uniref:HK97 family phage prohead protease n=1 Tax=Labrenzia sp. PHM005 TaxID=2590016 RepID=UPI00114004A8|nr:HK97 family phage prohead protease [Labrenzia sp. PHM005]QDG78425.1 HK97 family phage prohead protease [Labrenzia sp. PHM005]
MTAVRSSPVRIAGYASVFGKPDGAGDTVVSGAFRRSLALRPPARIALLWQHDPTRPIGRWTKLLETRHGLWAEGELANGVKAAQEAASLIASGALSGLSIGFKARKARYLGRGSGWGTARGTGRILQDIDLWEISLVTFPQADEARVRLLSPSPPAPAHWPQSVQTRSTEYA